MNRTLKAISSILGTVVATLAGLKMTELIRADKCLDIGGKVISWGACEFEGERAFIVELPNTTLVFLLFLAVCIALLISFLINYFGSKLLKT